jgi:hypothetical protein
MQWAPRLEEYSLCPDLFDVLSFNTATKEKESEEATDGVFIRKWKVSLSSALVTENDNYRGKMKHSQNRNVQ